jgi:hypothetical protein
MWTAMIEDPFASASEIKPAPKEPKEFGKVYNGRYHMPLLSGECGPKSIKDADYVSGGIQRMTNLVGAAEDTRALNVWEQAMALIGLALSPELYEELTLMVHQARSDGVNFELLREYPKLREALAGTPQDSGESIVGRAKRAARAEAAAQRGTNRHTAWEHRGETGELIGTPAMQEMVVDVERVLADAGLERVPGLSERIVRNTEIDAVGKFDDILREISTGRFLMSDLKTKAREFFTFVTVDAQLAGYAYAEWMLGPDGTYVPGPRYHVDLTEGVILHAPSDGSPAHLDRADLVQGWKVAKLARQIVDVRANGKSAARRVAGIWGVQS